MSSKTIKKAIKDVLENLAKDDMNKFCSALLDRRGEPRVPVSRVEGRDYLGIADVLVSTFTEEKAAQVTMDLLQEIKCFNQAKEFGKFVNFKFCIRRQHLIEPSFSFSFIFMSGLATVDSLNFPKSRDLDWHWHYSVEM